MLFVYMKCRFSLSYRDLEEMASIRGRIEARERGVGAPQRRRLAQRALDAGLLALLRDGHRERAESLVAGLLAEACAAGEAPQRDAVPPVGDGLMEDPCTR